MSKNELTLDEFVVRFQKIRAMDWVKSARRGPTGIGQTLENLLGLSENNIALPDFGDIELKAHRTNSNSMITLFTFNRKAWRMNPLEAVKKYGTLDKNGRIGLYFTMSRSPNGSGLFLNIDEDHISVRHVSGEVVAEWHIQTLAERFIEKIPALIFVSAFSEMRGDDEWFKFDRAQLLKDTSKDILHNQLLANNILVDLRLHDKGTSARNHGTGFRVYEDKLPLLFKTVQDI